jgi:hypothetical protein
MYRLQTFEYSTIYDPASDKYYPNYKLIEDRAVEYEDLPALAKQLKVSTDRLQATLENREPQIEKGNLIFRSYPYTWRSVRKLEPLESPKFVAEIEARNARLKEAQAKGNVVKPSELRGWEYVHKGSEN